MATVCAVTFGTVTRLFEGRGRFFNVEGNGLLRFSFRSTAAVRSDALISLATQAEAADQFVVLLDVPAFEVIEQAASLRDHLEQSAPRVVVFLVRFEVLGELVNACSEQRDLHLRRPRVALVRLVRRNDLFLRFSIQHNF